MLLADGSRRPVRVLHDGDALVMAVGPEACGPVKRPHDFDEAAASALVQVLPMLMADRQFAPLGAAYDDVGDPCSLLVDTGVHNIAVTDLVRLGVAFETREHESSRT